MRRDPYEVLGVGRDADDRAIKKAFRALARELHPDVNRHDPEAEEKFKEAAEAYEILSDADRRATYDRYGFEGLESRGYASTAHGFGSFADIFDAFFGGDPFGGGGFGGGAGRVQGGDVGVEVEITLEQAARGDTVEVAYDLVDACERCHGNRAEPGTPIETCSRCGGAGRLRAVTRTAFGQLVREQACDVCEGEGKIPSQPCEACGGRGRKAVRKTLSVDVPAGIADEQRIRLTGPRPRGRARRPSRRPLRARARRGRRALPARRQRPRDGRGRARPGGGAGRHGHRGHARRRGGARGAAGHPARHDRDAARPRHADDRARPPRRPARGA